VRRIVFSRKSRRASVYLAAICYVIVAWVLFEYVEGTMPVALPRLLITLLLACGVPVVVVLAWVVSGTSVRRRVAMASAGIVVFAVLVWLNNTALALSDGEPYLIAHRGVHQRMNPEHRDGFRCVARILPPTHDYIENTAPSIRAAFDLGARFVEIDIRQTRDEDFAVFHDDMLDCKTEARGPVAARTMDELRALDVGYGYFTEGGDHPLRGKGVGLMMSLHEILDAFPRMGFIIDVKFGNNEVLWTRLIEYLAARPAEDRRRIGVYGAARGVERLRLALPELIAGSRESALICARNYIVIGWTGYTPRACRRTMTGTYASTGWLFWGWPNRFVERMERAGTIVIMRPQGQTERRFAASITAGYVGGIQTDSIESFRDWMAEEAE
jgi:glycerophosphoryl diester phosphodiesterase